MEYILSAAGRERLAQFAGSQVLLAFDFDGTLAPIVQDPAQAAMRPRTRSLVQAVSRLYPCVVISGRSRSDTKQLVAGTGVAEVIGNHGAQGGRAARGVRSRVRRWSHLLHDALSSHRGVWIEDKQFSLAVHFRQSRNKRLARTAIRDAAAPLVGARIVGGKQVLNIVPQDAPHKGIALQRVQARLGCDTAIYVGDDDTDEDVFALDQAGDLLTVRVGAKRSSAARFYLHSQSEIERFLRILVDLRRRNGPRPVVRPTRASTSSPPPSDVSDARPVPQLGEVLDFMRLLWAVDHLLERVSKRMARTLGVTGPQRLVIRVVGRLPSIAAGRLANLLHLHPSTLTGILARLESAGLLDRRRDRRDRRRTMLALTAAGRELDVRLGGTVEDAVQRSLSRTAPADLLATGNLLRILHGELQATVGHDAGCT